MRSSTRATSLGSDRHQKLFGRSRGLSRVNVPVSTSRPVNRSHSSSDPSHHTTSSGWVRSAISRTHLASSGRLVPVSMESALNIAITPAQDWRARPTAVKIGRDSAAADHSSS